MRGPVDIVIFHALRHGLDPHSDEQQVTLELIAAAGGSRHVLERALSRVDLGLSERASVAGGRAHDALYAALAATAETTSVAVGLPA